MANPEHLQELQKGVESWNRWKHEHPQTWPDLSGADFTRANLGGANLGWTNLTQADLHGADLTGADLHWANLGGVGLNRAKFSYRSLVQPAEAPGIL